MTNKNPPTSPPSSSAWDYYTTRVATDDISAILNECGAQNWELVSRVPLQGLDRVDLQAAEEVTADAPRVMSDAQKRIFREIRMAEDLGDRALFCGITNDSTRAAAARARILALELADAPAGRVDGVLVTWRALFERHFAEAL